MQDSPNTLHECPKCGKQISRTTYRCPHCRESLAAYDQRKWERETPIPVSKEISEPQIIRSLKKIILSPLALFFLIAIMFILVLILSLSQRKETQNDTGKLATAGIPQIAPKPLPQNGKVDDPTSPSPAEKLSRQDVQTLADDLDVNRAKIEEAIARKQKIKSIADDIIAELKEEEAITTDTLYLKSGRELRCTIVDDLGTELKVRSHGVTTTIDKADIDRTEHRSQQSVDMQLRRMSLDQAMKIVDNGLVEYKGEWITPEEKELKVQAEKLELQKERLTMQAAAKTQQQTVQQPATPPATIGSGIDFSSVVVTEGQGFGDIIVGHPRCTKEFVKAKLGKPDIEKEHVLDYEWKYGMRFLFANDADLLIEIRFNRRFTGKLRSGISMTSSLEDVFAAYGQPVEEIETDDLGQIYLNYANRTLYRKDFYAKIWYREIGLVFDFEEDKVKYISIYRI